MKGLRNIARAISPFTSSKSKEKSADDYSWDLNNVDIEVLMRDFYTTYNPSRIDTIRTILDEYKGEELRMLQQLCNRYKIREERMQEYIDNAIIVKPLTCKLLNLCENHLFALIQPKIKTLFQPEIIM